MPQLDFLFAVRTSQRRAGSTANVDTPATQTQAAPVALLMNHSAQHFLLGGPTIFPAGFDLGGFALANLSRRFLNSFWSSLPFSPADFRFVIASEGIFLSDRRALNPFLEPSNADLQPKVITALATHPAPLFISRSLRNLVATQAASDTKFASELGLFLGLADETQYTPEPYTPGPGRDYNLAIPYVRIDSGTGKWDLNIALIDQRLKPWSAQIKTPVSHVIHLRPVNVDIGGRSAVTLSINVTPVYGIAPSPEKLRQFVAHIFPHTLVDHSKFGSGTPPPAATTTVSGPAVAVPPVVVSLRSFVRRAPTDGPVVIATVVVEGSDAAERDAQLAAVIAANQDPANHLVNGGELFADVSDGTGTSATAPAAAVIPFVRMFH